MQPEAPKGSANDLISGQQTKSFSSAAPAASPTTKCSRGPLPGQHTQSSTQGARVQPEAPKGSSTRIQHTTVRPNSVGCHGDTMCKEVSQILRTCALQPVYAE